MCLHRGIERKHLVCILLWGHENEEYCFEDASGYCWSGDSTSSSGTFLVWRTAHDLAGSQTGKPGYYYDQFISGGTSSDRSGGGSAPGIHTRTRSGKSAHVYEHLPTNAYGAQEYR